MPSSPGGSRIYKSTYVRRRDKSICQLCKIKTRKRPKKKHGEAHHILPHSRGFRKVTSMTWVCKKCHYKLDYKRHNIRTSIRLFYILCRNLIIQKIRSIQRFKGERLYYSLFREWFK